MTRGWQIITAFGIIACVFMVLAIKHMEIKARAARPVAVAQTAGGMTCPMGPGPMQCPMMPTGEKALFWRGSGPLGSAYINLNEAGAPAATRLPLIGEDAPAFKAQTTAGEIDFPKDYAGKWVILFSHPADFTPVCTTEFMTFQSMLNDFKALNCDLIGLSIDSNFSHIAWLRKIETMEWNGLKNVAVTFPVISDIKMEVAAKYGMVQPTASTTQAVRAVFFIDPQGKIRALIYYPLSNGRNFAEIKRLLMAMQTTDKFKVSTPANWQPGDDVIVPPPGSCGAAADRVKNPGPDTTCLDWFLCFKKLPKDRLAPASEK